MKNLQQLITNYLDYCKYQKTLNEKSLKAYRIDLAQYTEYMSKIDMCLTRSSLTTYLANLHKSYKPKSAKRKIASLKAFFSYLEYEEILLENPYAKIKVKFQEQTLIRDIAVLELLFSTGLRVSELCSLNCKDIDLKQGFVRIYGKGSKERIIQITNSNVINSLTTYHNLFYVQLQKAEFFFCNRLGNRLSEQSVRFMIKHYATIANISGHISITAMSFLGVHLPTALIPYNHF